MEVNLREHLLGGGHYLFRLSSGDTKPSLPSTWRSLKQIVMGPNPYFFGASVIVASILTLWEILRYVRGYATGYDLGSTAQSLYLISHGHWLAYNSFLGKPTILDIDAFILYLLAWPFRFMGGVYFLFVAQSVAVFIFGRAAYEYLFHRTGSRWLAWSFGILALISPAVIGGLMFDFHVDFIALLGLSLGLLAVVRQNRTLFICGIAVALLSKNEAALPIAAWAFVEFITPSVFTRWLWFWTGLSSLVLFMFDELLLPKMMGVSGASHLALFKVYGNSGLAIAKNLAEHPAIVANVILGHAHYLAELSGSWGFLPLVGGLYLLPFMALVILNDLANNSALRSLATQYSVIIDFFGLLAAGAAIRRHKGFSWYQAMPVAVAMFTSIFLLHGLWKTEIAPQIAPNNVAAKKFQLAPGINRQHHVTIWTTNHLAPLVYQHALVAENAYETVSTLWLQRRQYAPHSRIVVFMPKGDGNPAVTTSVWNALQSHYKLIAANSSAVVLEGIHAFSSYPVPAYKTQAPNDLVFPEGFPALLTVPGRTSISSSGWVISHGSASYRGLPATLPPGTYRIEVWLQDKHPGKQVWAKIRLFSSSKPQSLLYQKSVKGAASVQTLTWQTKSSQTIIPEIRVFTHNTVRYLGLTISRKSGPS